VAVTTPQCATINASTTGDNGNVFQILNKVDPTRSAVFTYDSLNRISQANTVNTTSSNCWGEVYTIDAWGNLTNRSAPSGMSGSCVMEALSATATNLNQLGGIGLLYDGAGNVTTDNLGNTYTYDAENRIVTDAGVTYYYDSDSVRIEKSPGTMYWPGPGGETLTETTLAGVINEEYVYFNGERIARVDRPSGTVHYYFSNHLGSASVIATAATGGGVTTAQTDYSPYGGIIYSSGSDPNHYKFTGKERDTESNLDMFGARYYASTMGRFMTPDWSSAPTAVPYADFDNPQSLNLYGYTKNNPTSLTDPNGHCTKGGKQKSGWWCFWNYSDQDEQYDADQARLNLSKSRLFVHGQPAEEWVRTATNQEVLAEQRYVVDMLREETWDNFLGTVGPVSTATVFLSTPGGMGTADFGQKVMKWGRGDADALGRIDTLTREELEQSGVTKEMAKEWRDFYKQVSAENPGNPSAAGREKLMQRAYELLGGK
jgi:RHS repeat-associated protein